jgi:hypothetical protein
MSSKSRAGRLVVMCALRTLIVVKKVPEYIFMLFSIFHFFLIYDQATFSLRLKGCAWCQRRELVKDKISNP